MTNSRSQKSEARSRKGNRNLQFAIAVFCSLFPIPCFLSAQVIPGRGFVMRKAFNLLLIALVFSYSLHAANVQFTGVGAYVPWPINSMTPGFSSTLVIDATGEQAAQLGQVWFPARTGSKTINKVHFRFGAVTKAGGSGLQVSLQDVSLTAGPPAQPDGVVDQYRAIANGEATFAANTWYTSGLLTSDGTDTGTKRTVNFGDLVACVLEYDVKA